ncbi:two-component response regulator [Sphaerospermopsis reniformis]|uniref:Two-component response regulator n=1 Tax=Sphaerospermopsis reniformis TaxID=531300 RepID=A0A480A6M6_9CYAN|nr:two-component response regulator [Sphaerospermopsis reniformis]
MRLILVEDEKDLGSSIHHALTQRDYIVDWVEDRATSNDFKILIYFYLSSEYFF